MQKLMSENPRTGWFEDSNDVYHASPGLSSSALKILALKSPAHFVHYLSAPKKTTPAMEWGTTVHSYILEGAPLAILPELNLRTNEGKTHLKLFTEKHAGQLVVTAKEADDLKHMRESVMALPVARDAIENGLIEHSGYAELQNGLSARIRPDIMKPSERLVLDLKTCEDGSREKFAKDIVNLGYHIQAAWYLRIANLISPDSITTFGWIAVEKSAPHCATIYIASEEFLMLGNLELDRALRMLDECLESNVWPGYSSEVDIISPPAWAKGST